MKNVVRYLFNWFNNDKYILAGQALTLYVLSQAFPDSIQLGANTLLASLAGALFVTISLVGAVGPTFAIFDYTKVGEYKLSLKNLSVREKSLIAVLTMVLGTCALQVLSLIFPAVIAFSNILVALLVVVACEIVSLGIDALQDIFTNTDSDEGYTRQGKRKAQPKGK